MAVRRGKPKLGQHFLIDEEVVDRIIELAQLPADATVVEIGPGEGVLTRALNAAVPSGQVLAIEVDGMLAFKLRERVSKRVKVIHADALRFDYSTVAAPYHVVSNLPYQITSPILHTLIGSTNPPESMTLMVQKEVAARILAPVHTRDRGLLTVITEWYGEREGGFDVPPEAFNPPPQVWSSVLRLVQHSSETLRVSGKIRPPFGPFIKLLKVGFSQKRRQIHHPLSDRFPMLQSSLIGLLAVAGIERTARAEELSYEQWVALYHALETVLLAD